MWSCPTQAGTIRSDQDIVPVGIDFGFLLCLALDFFLAMANANIQDNQEYHLTTKSSTFIATMDKCRKKHPKIQNGVCSEEVSSIEWEFIDMTEQEEDIISRMHRLVGDKWALIAGRVPGRKPEEIERFWLMRNSENFKGKRIEHKRR